MLFKKFAEMVNFICYKWKYSNQSWNVLSTDELNIEEKINLIQKQSYWGVLYKSILENFTKFTGKHQCQSLFLIKLQGLAYNFIKIEILAQVFSCEFFEIFINTFFYVTPPVVAFVNLGIRKTRYLFHEARKMCETRFIVMWNNFIICANWWHFVYWAADIRIIYDANIHVHAEAAAGVVL